MEEVTRQPSIITPRTASFRRMAGGGQQFILAYSEGYRLDRLASENTRNVDQHVSRSLYDPAEQHFQLSRLRTPKSLSFGLLSGK